MDITFNVPTRINLVVDKLDAPLMVCSHERSGTHFLMNSLASCTKYVSNPWLNYDLIPFGGTVNFYSENSVREFFANFFNMRVNGSTYGLASLVKSHFPLSMVQGALNAGIKVAYIYRNPVATLLSFWRLIHSLDWFEGPKLATPLDLARHVPCGQGQRYQTRNCECYFDRWALHVTDAMRMANTTNQVALVSYESLVSSHASSIKTLLGELGIALLNDPVYPSRERNVIVGAKIDVPDEAMQNLKEFCRQRAKLHPDLPASALEHI